MIKLQTGLEGKRAYFGNIQSDLEKHGYCLGGNWDYKQGFFDSILWREAGETIYLRLPFTVLEGELDNPDAYIMFQTPYVIKHVVNIGLDTDANSLASAVGLNQFQDPLDTDGQLVNKTKWEEAGEQAVSQVFNYVM